MANVLIVDAAEPGAGDVAGHLGRAGHVVAQARDTHEALAELERAEPDLILMSMPMLGPSGTALLDALADRRSDMPPVAILHHDVASGAEAVIGRVGPCRIVPVGKDWEETYARLMACIDPERDTPTRTIALPRPGIFTEEPEGLVA